MLIIIIGWIFVGFYIFIWSNLNIILDLILVWFEGKGEFCKFVKG